MDSVELVDRCSDPHRVAAPSPCGRGYGQEEAPRYGDEF